MQTERKVITDHTIESLEYLVCSQCGSRSFQIGNQVLERKVGPSFAVICPECEQLFYMYLVKN
jgi:hypothetical protein